MRQLQGVFAGKMMPETALSRVTQDSLLLCMLTNAIGPALVVKHFTPLLTAAGKARGKSAAPAVVANLSARVGSISDNGLGGWYSYRCACQHTCTCPRTVCAPTKLTGASRRVGAAKAALQVYIARQRTNAAPGGPDTVGHSGACPVGAWGALLLALSELAVPVEMPRLWCHHKSTDGCLVAVQGVQDGAQSAHKDHVSRVFAAAHERCMHLPAPWHVRHRPL